MDYDYDLLMQLYKLGDINRYLIMIVLPICIILAVVGHFLKIKWFKHTTFFLLIVVLLAVIIIYSYIWIGYKCEIY